jgi:hypothetical protein
MRSPRSDLSCFFRLYLTVSEPEKICPQEARGCGPKPTPLCTRRMDAVHQQRLMLTQVDLAVKGCAGDMNVLAIFDDIERGQGYPLKASAPTTLT